MNIFSAEVRSIISAEPHALKQRAAHCSFNENELRTHTLRSKVRYFHVTHNVKMQFFQSKNFNIFYLSMAHRGVGKAPTRTDISKRKSAF